MNSLFGKRAFKNALTAKIESDPKINLEEILLHKDLPSAIRNESEILYNKILKNTGNKFFIGIVNYALFDENPPREYQNLKRKQINNNAANFLENCGKRFSKYIEQDKSIFDYVQSIPNKFIKGGTKTDPMYAGHFQRFFENFLRWGIFEKNEVLIIIQFLVENCRILAYQQLVMKIITDYNDEDTIYYLIQVMLYRSFSAVKFIYSKFKKHDNVENNFNSTIYKDENLKQKFTYDQQPLNLHKNPIPLIDAIFQSKNSVSRSEKSDIIIKWKEIKDFPNINNIKIKFDSEENAEMEAYLLIMSIRTSILDQTEIIKYFRETDVRSHFPLIQALLYCGTYCSSKSLISLEAFRLLSIIFNGSEILNISAWDYQNEAPEMSDLLTLYAKKINYDSKELTYKMIHALPIFWNFRYNEATYDMSNDEKKEIDVSDYYPPYEKNDDTKGKSREASKTTNEKTRRRESGETALEILQPCLFCDPPISSQLVFTCQDIFIQLIKKRKMLRKAENNDANIKERIRLDGIMLDYYQHQFNFGKKKNVTFPDIIEDIVPLEPTNIEYQKIDEKRRASLSGFAVNFFLTMSSMKYCAFFETVNTKGTNKFSKMIKCSAIDKINSHLQVFLAYQEFTHFDKLSENTIYNKPVHSEFYFETEDEEEENNEDTENQKPKTKIIVDEIDKAKSHLTKNGKKMKRVKKKKGENEKGKNEKGKNEKETEIPENPSNIKIPENQ